jgi:flagellin
MTAINTNTGSLYAQQAMNTNSRGLATVMQQLSTGKRINNAVDDVAGMAISTRLTSQIRGLNQAVRNANDGISLIQTAEGATEQVTNMLQRMRELAVQSSNDTNNEKDRGFLDLEFQQLKAEIDRIGQNTQWNGANILDGTGGNNLNGVYAFQVGANTNQTIKIKLPDMQTAPAAPSVTAYNDINDPTKWPTYAGGVATVDFTGLDGLAAADAQKSVGVVVQSTFAGKSVQYKITQEDINSIDAAANPPVKLSAIVANALVAKLDTPLWSDNYKAATASNSGIITVTPVGAATPLSAANKNAEVKTVVGDLKDVATSTVTTADNAYKALQNIDSVLQTVNAARSNMGAIISRLQFAVDNLSNVSAKATESRSRIEDTDYATATTELAKRNIIQQASQAMLAQANQAPQMVLQLLK